MRLAEKLNPFFIWHQNSKLFLNGSEWTDMFEFTETLENKGIGGLEVKDALTVGELTLWLKWATLPVSKPNKELMEHCPHLRILEEGESREFEITVSSAPTVSIPFPSPAVEKIPTVATAPAERAPDIPNFEVKIPIVEPALTENKINVPLSPNPVEREPESVLPASSITHAGSNEVLARETFLSFLAEAWQHAQLQRKMVGASAESAALAHSFEKLFDRLVGRIEKSGPEFEHIAKWFKADEGDLLDKDSVEAMVPLMETAVANGWTSVLFDPATEGLVNDCLARWGAQGKAELVEKTVGCLAEGLAGDRYERELALTHLMDARPWIHRQELVDHVLEKLNLLLGAENSPSLYQSGLLLAWDLVEPAINTKNESHVLALLATLHFHADEDSAAFPDRNRIARHWLFERSNPALIRKLAACAFRGGQLRHFPLLGEMAAPLLLQDFIKAPTFEKANILPILTELREPLQSVLAEKLADMGSEEQVKALVPLLRISGFDPSLGLLLARWLSRGSRELKLNLLGLIEYLKDPVAGLALRFALFDDSEEIAARAARVAGIIGFKAVIPVLIKAAKVREGRFPDNQEYLKAVCQSMGDLRDPAALEILEDIARKKPVLRGKTHSLEVRLAAIEALTKLQKPEAWEFVEKLMEEKNPALQEALENLINAQTQSIDRKD
jgi:HEAT repeat protein